MIFHLRHASLGDSEMTLFWTTFDSHAVLPWIIASIVAIVGFAIVRATSADLVEAWNDANTNEATR